MMRIMLSGLMIILLTACGGNSESERKDGYSQKASNPEDSLFQEVMDGHDAAMAKMGKLAGYRKQVDQKIDSLKRRGSASKAELIKKYDSLRAELKAAEDHMNQWMQEFSIDSAQGDIEKRLDYLGNEKIKVDKVKEEIFGVLKSVDSVFSREEKGGRKE